MSRVTRCSTWVILQAASFAAAIVAPPAARAQRPTPIDRLAVVERLPKPENVSVVQGADGSVVLSWSPVAGAKQYILGRSLGTAGYQRVYQDLAGATRYIDRAVPVGTRVSYTITPVDSSDVAGMRATSADFTPTTPAHQLPRPPAPVATIEGSQLVVRWEGITGQRYGVAWHRSYGTFGSGGEADAGYAHEWRLNAQPGAYSFAVIAKPANPTEGASQSDYTRLDVPADSSGGAAPALGPAPTGPGVPAPAAPAAPSEVSLTVASPVALRAGATTQLSAPVGAQWLSLDAAIAGVSAQGLVTARTAGIARIVALSTQAAGATRVTVVHVTVSP